MKVALMSLPVPVIGYRKPQCPTFVLSHYSKQERAERPFSPYRFDSSRKRTGRNQNRSFTVFLLRLQ